MRTSIRFTNALVLLAAAALLAACGDEGKVEGSVVVNAGSASTLTIEGVGKTSLELDHRGSQPVVMTDGANERRLVEGASVRFTFEGPKTLLFRNEGNKPARIHYKATSPGGVSSSLEQR